MKPAAQMRSNIQSSQEENVAQEVELKQRGEAVPREPIQINLQDRELVEGAERQSLMRENINEALPAREKSIRAFVSGLSQAGLLVGTGLSFFDTKGVRIAGTVVNGSAFVTKQVADYLKNKENRDKIIQKQQELTELAERKSKDVSGILTAPNKHWDKFGLEVNKWVIIATLINTLLQAAATGYGAYVNYTGTDKDIPNKIIVMALVLLALTADAFEQHIKSDNLERRIDQFENAHRRLDRM